MDESTACLPKGAGYSYQSLAQAEETGLYSTTASHPITLTPKASSRAPMSR